MILKKISILFVVVCMSSSVFGHLPVGYKKKKVNNLISSRNDCSPATEAVDMQVNNVRARLRIGGDLWWDGQQEGRYVIPKPAPGFPEVSSIFSGGVWLGGQDPAGNLKVAITQYPSGNVTDFWAGPLDEMGETSSDICNQWNRFFKTEGRNVRNHIANWEKAEGNPDCDEIPDDVKYWPGRGNPFWAEKFTFDLPDQNLGAYWDQDGDGIYDPCQGDFPIINIRGCEPRTRLEAKELVPDEMIFWIYNDAGNEHQETGADKIQMEIQVQAFAYATNDEVNDMTFLRYRLINKAIEDIQDCYFAMWLDPDLGCSQDDYIGCDVGRSMAYIYNEDAIDGNIGDACSGGVNTYGSNIPLLGVDYFRGPRGPKVFKRDEDGNIVLGPDGFPILLDPLPGSGNVDTLVELGMTSFGYTNSGSNNEPPGTLDPQNGGEAYNILRGFWRDGRAITYGGTNPQNSGYNELTNIDTVKYAFPGLPNSDSEWSMCTAELPIGDRRTIQATGPLLLQVGGLPEELIVGVPFVPNVDYPCPNIRRLQFADDIAQALFDNCFDITDGPDAPDMCGVELDQQLILLLSNDTLRALSNNYKQLYEEVDLQAPGTVEDNMYKFEGYRLYQLINPAVSVQELDDVTKAVQIRQVDIKNGILEIPKYISVRDPRTGDDIFIPEIEPAVQGLDRGLTNSFNVTTDAFTGETLINHKDYYFLVVAYAYNNYDDWNVEQQTGQRRPYLEGRGNVKSYTFTPRPIVYQDLQSAYGQEAQITRISGVGSGTNFLDIDDDYQDLLDPSWDGKIKYKIGQAPISVKVTDPLNIKNGRYQLEIVGDYNDGASKYEGEVKWKLTNLDTNEEFLAEVPVHISNEQLIYEQGFSVSVAQGSEPGNALDNNGAIGQSITYSDPEGPQWWNGGSGAQIQGLLYDQPNKEVDSLGLLTRLGNGAFTPLQLTRWEEIGDNGGMEFFISPNLRKRFKSSEAQGYINIESLNNVDVILTSDTSLWSRCIVVEGASNIYSDNGLNPEGDVDQFSLRNHDSVDKLGNDEVSGKGMGWFPGYAIDVESGERLNIFFAENSAYNDERSQMIIQNDTFGNGDDMIWNPNQFGFAPPTNGLLSPLYQLYMGGQHFVYVTKDKYDGCAELHNIMSDETIFSSVKRGTVLGSVTYTGFPLSNIPLLDISEGLIPNDVTFKVRVTNSYNKETVAEDLTDPQEFTNFGDTPVYQFEFGNVAATEKEYGDEDNPLADVNVVPNPYYAYSAYETSQFDNSIKVTNLPARATVTIYSLDGKFIKQFRRDESPSIKEGSNPARAEGQIYPALEWDLKNDKGIPVASGVYIFHIEAPDLNAERSIKWFGVNRKFDPTGL